MTSKARRNGRAEKNKLNQTKCTQLGKEWEERERGTVMEKRNNKQEWDQERCPEERTRLPCAGTVLCVLPSYNLLVCLVFCCLGEPGPRELVYRKSKQTT